MALGNKENHIDKEGSLEALSIPSDIQDGPSEKLITSELIAQHPIDPGVMYLINKVSPSDLEDVNFEVLKTGEANSFNKFAPMFAMGFASEHQKEIVENLLSDKDLREAWNDLIKFELSGEKKDEEYVLLLNKVRDAFVSKASDASYLLTGADFNRRYKGFVYFYRATLFESLIIEKLDEKAAEERRQEMNQLKQSYVKGELSTEEYIKRTQEAIDAGVKKVGDEELENAWKDALEEQQELESVFVEEVVDAPDEDVEEDGNLEKVKDKEEVKKVLNGTDMGEFPKEVNSDGTIDIALDGDFSVKVVLRKNASTNEYVFYAFDSYSQKPVKASPDEIKMVLDERHVDAFVSEGISEFYLGDDSIADVPDRLVTKLGVSLIGEGTDRNFIIEGEDRMVMENLVGVLIEEDKSYGSLVSKIEALSKFVETPDNKDFLYRSLLESDLNTVSALIGEE